jgi:hypothetical protein
MNSADTLELMKNLKRAWQPRWVQHRQGMTELHHEYVVLNEAHALTQEAVEKLKPRLSKSDLKAWEHWSTH